MECNVCAEKYTKLYRKPVKCPFCNYECCLSCAQTYLLGTTQLAHCMSCQKAWTRLFMVEAFTKSFVTNKYKAAREDVLLNLEKAMIKDTMPHAEHALLCRKNKKTISDNMVEITKLNNQIARFRPETLEDKRVQCDLIMQVHQLEVENLYLEFECGVRKIDKGESRKFIKHCPRSGCEGYLSMKWKCAVCEKYTCSKCHEPRDSDEHECDPEVVKNVEFLRDDTHPCPKCGIPIHKIEGCDQMYCTECHTAFSWRTGKIEVGRIHNPHYYDYMRRRGEIERENGDIQCGGMPNIYDVINHMSIISIDVLERSWMQRFMQILYEYEQYEMPRLMPATVTAFDQNLDLRVRFIIKEIGEYMYKTEIYRRDKDRNKRNEQAMVSTTFIQIMSDILQRVKTLKMKDEYLELRLELVQACQYINQLFLDISKAYDCTVPSIQVSPVAMINRVKYRNPRAVAKQGEA